MYRVNSKGLFNVPFNNAVNPLICDEGNLRECFKLLKIVELKTGDYSDCLNFIDEKTFVYIDPPYRPLTLTSSFTSYSVNMFDDNSQIQLGNFVKDILKKGAYVVISNSDPKNINQNDNFFDDIYSGLKIERVKASRMISCKADGRAKLNELLISNYGKNYRPLCVLVDTTLKISSFGLYNSSITLLNIKASLLFVFS